MATSKKSAGKGGKKSPSGAKGKSTAKNKASARAEWEARRNRFITAIVQVLSAVLLLFICFMPGESLWLVIHKFYNGVFGMFGFAFPAVMIYCAVQNFRDEPAYNFKLKAFLFALLTIFLSTSVFCFQAGDIHMTSYFEEIGKSYTYASENIGTGVLGGILGIPLKMAAGAVGGGIISIIATIIVLAFILDSVLVSILEAFKTPARIVGEHISDNREIRNEVRRREKEIREEKRTQTRKQYVEDEIDRRMKQKHPPEEDDNLCRIKNQPFYEPERTSGKKRRAEQKKEQPQQTKENIPVQAEEGVLENSDDMQMVGKDIPLEDLIFKPDGEVIYENNSITHEQHEQPGSPEQEIVPEPIYQPEKKQKKNKSETERFEIDPESTIISGHYIKPPFSLLEPQPGEKEANLSMELNQRGKTLIDTLKSFGVQATVINISRGPAVTRYELQPASGVKISRITNLADDIALNLAATRVRIEAPIPGKSAVGIEVPNKTVTIVKMRNLVESREFQTAKSKLTVALGVDIAGKITLADLGKMPHLLIAGSTGSGKSVCVNSMLISLLYKSSPDEVKLLLIDPKVVELGIYNGIPHLLVPVVTDPRKAAGALSWAVNEMLNRYKLFAEYNVRDMQGYNRFVERQNDEIDENTANDYHSDMEERSFEEDEMLAQAQSELGESGGEEESPEPKKLQKMPHIVIVIDELADLMMAASKEVEESICRLAQMARAAGMHLVIATQRPSVDVITGLIKANIPSRIAFAVKSVTDSRTILDTGGADKLLGRGDMLFSPIGTTKPVRVQGCFVDDSEINNIIDFIKKNKVVEYDENVIEEIERNAVTENNSGDGDDFGGERDPMIEEAIRCVVEAGQASTSMLQRRLRLGYARAGRIIDEMEQMGIVGPHEGAKPRKVLMTYQEYAERMLNNSDN